jgi:UDP-N-acetylmuramoyl-tripeptide--D-alanyl-D-alanine ligase
LITAELPGDRTLCFTLSQSGEHWVSNAMAVLAAVDAVDGDLATAGLALAELGGLSGRGARHTLDLADGSALLIDESYNANPASMAATLAELGKIDAARRIVILGAMRELGAQSARYHAELAAPIVAAGVDIAILVGDHMAHLVAALDPAIKTLHVPDVAAALIALQVQVPLQSGDAILVKGSNSIGLSRIIDMLTAQDIGLLTGPEKGNR